AGAAERLSLAVHRNQRQYPFWRGRRRANDWLEVHLRQLAGELLFLQEVEQRRVAGQRRFVEVSPERDWHPIGHLPDVLDDPIEGALATAQRSHPIMSVAIAVESDLHASQTERYHPVNDVARQQQTVGDDAEANVHVPRLRRCARALGV